jgi:hypothetical protein
MLVIGYDTSPSLKQRKSELVTPHPRPRPGAG